MTSCLTLASCSSPAPEQDTCGPAHATFRLFVDAEDGEVPPDVRIQVRYGSGEEVFDASEPDASLKVLFCELKTSAGGKGDAGAGEGGADAGWDAGADAGPDGPDAGLAGGPIEQVVCELWTDGAATVRVEARGYPELVEDLEAEWDEKCGIVLTEAHITLTHEPER